MHIKIRDGISVIYQSLKNQTYEVNFLFKVSGRIVTLRLNQTAFLCLKMLDGEHSVKNIASQNGVSAQEILNLSRVLRERGLIDLFKERVQAQPTERFKNQLNFFADFETHKLNRHQMQARLRASKVVIIGLGGIGSWVVQGLTLAGVQNFVLVDPDTIANSNLNRQALYKMTDLGKFKVDVAQLRITQLNSDVNCLIIKKMVKSAEDVANFSSGANLVINCADQPATDQLNRWVTDACFSVGQSHILCGGYDGHLSFLGPTVIPGNSACWYCYEKSLDRRLAAYQHLKITKSEIDGGSLGSISAVTANLHVLEATKILSGFGKPSLRNAVAEIDFHRFQLDLKRFRRQRGCKICNGGKNER